MDAWMWGLGNIAGAQVLDPFSDPYTVPVDLDCTARTYVLSGTAFDEGILTLTDETPAQDLVDKRTLRLLTTQPAHANINTFTARITVDMDINDFPYLVPLLQQTVDFTVTIIATC